MKYSLTLLLFVIQLGLNGQALSTHKFISRLEVFGGPSIPLNYGNANLHESNSNIGYLLGLGVFQNLSERLAAYSLL